MHSPVHVHAASRTRVNDAMHPEGHTMSTVRGHVAADPT